MQEAAEVIVSNSYMRTVFALVIIDLKYLLYFVIADSQFSATDPVNNFASVVVTSIKDSSVSHKYVTQSESIRVLLFRENYFPIPIH
jgi:hypothetical protein